MPLTNRVNFQEFIKRLKLPVVWGSNPRGGTYVLLTYFLV
jgi:hypothetical protein